METPKPKMNLYTKCSSCDNLVVLGTVGHPNREVHCSACELEYVERYFNETEDDDK